MDSFLGLEIELSKAVEQALTDQATTLEEEHAQLCEQELQKLPEQLEEVMVILQMAG